MHGQNHFKAILDISHEDIQRHCQVRRKEFFCKTRNKSIAQEENKKRKWEIRDKKKIREIKEYFTYVLQKHVRLITKDTVGTSSVREETQEKCKNREERKKRRKERNITVRQVQYWKEHYIFRSRRCLEKKKPCLVTMKKGVLEETINCSLWNQKYEELLT